MERYEAGMVDDDAAEKFVLQLTNLLDQRPHDLKTQYCWKIPDHIFGVSI